MATFTAIQCKKQSASSMRGVIDYVEQEKKTRLGDAWLVTGSNCVPQSAFIEMQMTKERFRKTGGTQFYHFVQSFSAEDDITPQEVNAIGLEFAQKQFPDFEVVIATHVDTGHLHNHMVVNSVSHKDGHKLHQSYSDLLTHRKVNDEICLAHGLSVLGECDSQKKKKRMKPGEYQAGLRGDSWKLDLIQAINEALEYATSRESFIENMEVEGYEVSWSDSQNLHLSQWAQVPGQQPPRRNLSQGKSGGTPPLPSGHRLPSHHPGAGRGMDGRAGRWMVPGSSRPGAG